MFVVAFLVVALSATAVKCQSSNEGTRFAFALTPSAANVHAELILTARQDTVVLVEYPFLITELVQIQANQVSSVQIEDLLRTVDGFQNVGIILSSIEPFSAYIASEALPNPRVPEATILRPVNDEDTEFFVASYSPAAASDVPPKAFYSIVPVESDTSVQVYQIIGGSYVLIADFTVDAHQVFTRDAYHHDENHYEVDYTGLYIEASAPIAVYSGNGGALLPATADGVDNRYVFESMPSVHNLGSNYITYPYHFGERLQGYHVRVISVADDTLVEVPALGISQTLGAGQALGFNWISSRQGTPIECSNPCMVAQYAHQAGVGESPGEFWIRPFMQVLTPMEDLTNDVVFATPGIAGQPNDRIGLSIVADHYPQDMYIDGINLEGLDWNGIGVPPYGFYATTNLEPGWHRIWTTYSDERFVAYLHGSSPAGGGGQQYSWGCVTGYGDANSTSTSTVRRGVVSTLWQRIKRFFKDLF